MDPTLEKEEEEDCFPNQIWSNFVRVIKTRRKMLTRLVNMGENGFENIICLRKLHRDMRGKY
jgi:hypothetical protein